MCMWRFTSYRRFHEMLEPAEDIQYELEFFPDVPYVSVDNNVEEFEFNEVSSLDLGSELDMDNNEGNLLDMSAEDLEIDDYLKQISMMPHTYCNILKCMVHGSYFKCEDSG